MSRSVLITGASSGLGEAMALEFARRGYHLALTARRVEALEGLASRIRQEWPQVRVEVAFLDVCDTASVAPVIDYLAARLGDLDIVVANAGVAANHRVGSGHLQDDLHLMQTNVLGAMATIDAATAWFKKAGKGHIVAISSVAAKRGMPGLAAYSASKAALATYMESLRAELHGTPLKTTTLYPGYIDTPLNNMVKNRPFVIDIGKGGKALVDLIEKQVSESTVPVYPWKLLSIALQLAPTAMLASGKKR